MAKKTMNREKVNYSSIIRALKENGPGRLYLLCGPEDYLREQFLSQIKKLCFPDGDDGFSYKRLNGEELEYEAFQEAVDAMPFLCGRSLVEVRDADINRLKEQERYIQVLSDIPDYCTVVFVQGADYEPDGRIKLVKKLRELGEEIKFEAQSQGMLIDWIIRRFAAAGKRVELEAAQRLIFISGDLMNRLIPEIEKIAAYSNGERVSVEDVEAVASRIPEAEIFDMTDYISQKKYNTAVSILAELLENKDNEPIPMLAMLGSQMRRLYAARLAIDDELGVKFVMDACGIKYEFIAKKLLASARGFSLGQLKKAVELCAEADYKIKSSSQDDRELLKETVLRIAAGEC